MAQQAVLKDAPPNNSFPGLFAYNVALAVKVAFVDYRHLVSSLS